MRQKETDWDGSTRAGRRGRGPGNEQDRGDGQGPGRQGLGSGLDRVRRATAAVAADALVDKNPVNEAPTADDILGGQGPDLLLLPLLVCGGRTVHVRLDLTSAGVLSFHLFSLLFSLSSLPIL